MLRPTGNAPNQMTDAVKIELPTHFPADHLAHKSGFAAPLGSSATS
jgi:hypothetical protein